MAATVHDVSLQNERLQGAWTRNITWDNEFQAFCTTEKMSVLFTRQQQQLKLLQRTLVGEDDHENSYTVVDSSVAVTKDTLQTTIVKSREESNSTSSTRNIHAINKITNNGGADDARANEHGFNVDGLKTRVVPKNPGAFDACNERSSFVQKCTNIAEEEMQLDHETQVEENLESNTGTPVDGLGHCSPLRAQDGVSSDADSDGDAAVGLVSGTQGNASQITTEHSEERWAPKDMIGIDVPEPTQEFYDGGMSDPMSSIETEGSEGHDDGKCSD